MQTLLRAGALTLALFGSVGLAVAQNAPGGGSTQDQLSLTPAQKQTIRQGLTNEQTQTTPGSQGQVGSKAPGSVTPHSLPSNVMNQVPATKNLLFVKLPDRILLIDPDNKLVTQIVTDDNSSTTGSNTGGSSTNTSDRPSR
jgi:hypothetical protein